MRVLVLGQNVGCVYDAVIVGHDQLLCDRFVVLGAAERADVPLGCCSGRVLQLDQRERGIGANIYFNARLRLKRLRKEPGLIILHDPAIACHIDGLRLSAGRSAQHPDRRRDSRSRDGPTQELPAVKKAARRTKLITTLVSHDAPPRSQHPPRRSGTASASLLKFKEVEKDDRRAVVEPEARLGRTATLWR